MSKTAGPVWSARLAWVLAAALTGLALLPLLDRLPKVIVVTCFESGHPLYQWVPETAPTACLSMPGEVVGWVLMIAGTTLVHAALLPALMGASAVLLRTLLRLVGGLDALLAGALLRPRPAHVPATGAALPRVPVLSARDAGRALPLRRGPPLG